MKKDKICPFTRKNCRDDCELFNQNLKGCHFCSLVLNINKLVNMLSKKKTITRQEFEEKYKGKSKEEIEKELFGGG